jgi:protease-4
MKIKKVYITALIVSILLMDHESIFSATMDSVLLPNESVATTEDVTALNYNPAGLAHHPGQFSFHYGWLGNGTGNSVNTYLSLPFLSLGFDSATYYDKYVDDKIDLSRFLLALSFGVDDIFFFGASFTWFFSDNAYYEPLNSVNLGFQLQPFSWLSLGLVLKNLNEPTFIKKAIDTRVRTGVGLRPFGEWFTFATDFEFPTVGPNDDVRIILSSKLLFPYNFFANGEYNLYTKNFQINAGYEYRFVRLDYNTSTHDYSKSKNNNSISNHQIGLLFSAESFSRRDLTKKYLELVLKDRITETKTGSFLFPSDSYTTHELIKGIKHASEDSAVHGIILKIDSVRAGFGKVQEIRNALKQFKKSGKKVITYLESPGNREYYLASVSDKIIMAPTSTLAVLGLKAELFFIKDLLDKIGVEADLIPVGEYKSAVETFTRNSPTRENTEAVKSILTSISDEMVKEIRISRGNMDKKKLLDLIDIGFLSAKKAKQENLIDDLKYYHEFKEELRKKSSLNSIITARAYFNEKPYIRLWGPRRTIVILHIDETIVTGKNKSGGIFSSSRTGSDTIADTIKKINDQKGIEGVIVRVDSPGGSGLASDIIWKSIKSLKKKKVLVSFSDVAASGGYFVATGADTIIANPSTITGSIGAYGGKFSLKGLYQKLGINKTTIRQAKNAAMFTEGDKFTDSERILLKEHLKEFYEVFLKRVSDGRKITRDKAHEIARGRVWTGKQAKKNGLVDRLGGLGLAIEMMKASLKIDTTYPIRIIHLPKKDIFGFIASGEIASAFGITPEVKKAARLTLEQSKFKDNEVLFLMPYTMEIK